MTSISRSSTATEMTQDEIYCSQFRDLGISKEKAAKLTKNLDCDNAYDAVQASTYMKFAKDIQKLAGFDLTKGESMDWVAFVKFVADVASGNITISSAKLFEFIKYFSGFDVDSVKEVVISMYRTVLKIYNSMPVQEFLKYLGSTKVMAATTAMSDLKKSVNTYCDLNEKIRQFYGECFLEYEQEVLYYVERNEILKIKTYNINHILNMLSELSVLVEKAKKDYLKLLKKIKDTKNKIEDDKKKLKKVYDNRMNVALGSGCAGGVAAVAGIAGIFLGPVMWPFAIGVGIGIICAGGSAAAYHHNKDEKVHGQPMKLLKDKQKECDEQLKYLKDQNVYKHLCDLAQNIKTFQRQMEDIKKQYEVKRSLKEHDGNVAQWLAQKNGHDKNKEKLKIYEIILDELGVDNFETFNNLEAPYIDEMWIDIKKNYNFSTKDLFHIKKVIKKYALDQHIITGKVKKMSILNLGDH